MARLQGQVAPTTSAAHADEDPRRQQAGGGPRRGYTIKPALSLALTATKITLGKTVNAKGIMHRVVKLGKVSIRVQRKSASDMWKTLLTKSVTSTALDRYSWKYKPLEKGSYRMRASVPVSGKILAGKTANKTFAVK